MNSIINGREKYPATVIGKKVEKNGTIKIFLRYEENQRRLGLFLTNIATIRELRLSRKPLFY